MNEPELKALAFDIAEATPRHLDHPTTPPIHWRLEGTILRVLLADGRTVRGLYKWYAGEKNTSPSPVKAMPTGYMPLTPDPSPKKMGEGKTSTKSPAKHKAGK